MTTEQVQMLADILLASSTTSAAPVAETSNDLCFWAANEEAQNIMRGSILKNECERRGIRIDVEEYEAITWTGPSIHIHSRQAEIENRLGRELTSKEIAVFEVFFGKDGYCHNLTPIATDGAYGAAYNYDINRKANQAFYKEVMDTLVHLFKAASDLRFARTKD